MNIRTTHYRITTLCKPEHEAILRADKSFRETVLRIFSERPECKDKVLIGRRIQRNLSDIELGEKRVSVCRLEWPVGGAADKLKIFFEKWNDLNDNPCRSFFIRPEYTLAEVSKYMKTIKEDDQNG